MNLSRRLASLALAGVGALAIGGSIYNQLYSPTSTGEQVVSSTTQVTVVFIPGFPAESLALGLLLGLAALVIIRRRKGRKSTQ